jgi:DNA-binding Lrp family transcriptional regulator
MSKIDEKDIKLLYELSKNCRKPLNQIAKKTGMSREVADYRIKRLIENRIIRKFITEIDLLSLGFTKNVIYLEVIGVTGKQEEEIQSMLEKNPYVSWLVSSTGKWSFIFDLHAKDPNHLAELLDKIKENIGDFLGEIQVATLRDFNYFHSKFFGEETERKRQIQKQIILDEKDMKILHNLSDDGRISWIELAGKMSLTPEAISYRVKNLVSAGIIRQFYIFVDLQKLGFELYNIQIMLSSPGRQTEGKILRFLKTHPKVCFFYRPATGPWDIEFGVFVKGPGGLRKVMRELRERFPGKIRIRDTFLFYEEITSTALPEGVFKKL